MSDSEQASQEAKNIMNQVEGLLKKAISLGAGAYFSAEEVVNNAVNSTVNKTLNTVQIPKGLLKQLVEELMDSYTITVQAEIKLVPKNGKSASKEAVKIE